MASGQSVNLTAGPHTLILPDGNSVPMWGYTCDRGRDCYLRESEYGRVVTGIDYGAGRCNGLDQPDDQSHQQPHLRREFDPHLPHHRGPDRRRTWIRHQQLQRNGNDRGDVHAEP